MANTTSVDNIASPTEPRDQRQTNQRALLLALLAALLFAWWWFGLREAPTPGGGVTPPSVTIEPGFDTAPAPTSGPDSRVATKPKAGAKPKPLRPATTTAQPLASNPIPRYPTAALRRNEGGKVLLRVSIGSDGTPTDIDVAQRSGSRDLDRAAITAVRKWQFRPATRNGQPVASTVEVPVEFRPTGLASL